MLIQLNIHVLLAVFFSLSLGAMTQISNCENTTETLCDGTVPGDNGPHTQYECTTDMFSSIELQSCGNENQSVGIYWFWYNDLCRNNRTQNAFFVVVYPNNTFQCRNNTGLSITPDSCNNDYTFTRQSMIIKNITNSTSQKYICFLGISQSTMNFTSAIIYSVNISESTTSATTVLTTTSLSATSFVITSTTISNSNNSTENFSTTETSTSGTPPLLQIILPTVVGVVFIVLLIIGGFFYYRRRQRKKKPDDYNLRKVSSVMDQQHQVTYGDDTTMLDSDNGYSIWRPVQQKT